MAGSTRRAALIGTLSRSIPAGRSRNTLTTTSAASTPSSAGASPSIKRAPASVGVTLRVVRWSRRTPNLSSRRRTASLRADALAPLARAASRKPRACATARKAFRSPRSAFIVHQSAPPVQIMPDYRGSRQRLPVGHQEETDHADDRSRRDFQTWQPHREAPRLWRHATGGPRGVRTATRQGCGGGRATRGGGGRRRSYRRLRLLWASHHAPEHPRGAGAV